MTEAQEGITIPEAAIEAATIAIYAANGFGESGYELADYRQDAQVALKAAAPYLPHGDGDYRPGWDDRKTLSGLWQEHSPLPEEGLSERVYEALIEIAAWGYQRRMDEEL